MIINNTFLSLNVFSLLSSAPFYTIYKTNQGLMNSAFYNSRFSRSFSSIIFSETIQHQTIISKSMFSHIMGSAIYLTNAFEDDCKFIHSDGSNYQLNDIIKKETIRPESYLNDTGRNYRPYFRKENADTDKGASICGDITITECVFDSCYAESYSGGSIHIEQDCKVMIHSTIFNNSYTGERFGGAGVICKKITNEKINFETEKIEKLDVRYCCFQDCYGTGTIKNKNKLYGVALFMASNVTALYFASTVNCPGIDNDRAQACGAQFDMNADNVTSQYVNATGGNSEYCGGIEYRSAQVGFFKFQTISQMECMFAISYTDIGEATLDLSYSNVFDIKLVRSEAEKTTKVHPGLIHIRRTKEYTDDYLFSIKNFCFINNNFDLDSYSRIVSRGTKEDGDYQPIKIVLIDCYYDCGNDKVAITDGVDGEKLSTDNCNIGDIITNEVIQLSLGDCQGKATPGPLIDLSPTNEFSETGYFSESSDFTKSKVFQPSNKFTLSSKFTKSNMFSDSESLRYPEQSPYVEPIPILPGGGDEKSGKKASPGMIAGIAVGAAAVVAALIVGLVFFLKKRNHISGEDVETIDNTVNSIESVNPIYNNGGGDDPFKEDFQ